MLWDKTCHTYGVATVSRIDKVIGLFCRIASLLYVSFAKETCNLIDPTNCSHPTNECIVHYNALQRTATHHQRHAQHI